MCIHIQIHMYVCMYVCMHVCMYVCVYIPNASIFWSVDPLGSGAADFGDPEAWKLPPRNLPLGHYQNHYDLISSVFLSCDIYLCK